MATVIKNESINCPCCGTDVDVKDIERRGLKNGILIELDKQIRDGILEETFAFAKSMRRQIDPSSTSTELAISEKLDQNFKVLTERQHKMNSTLNSIVGGTGKGEIAEMLISETFRQFFPQDEFDTKNAAKGGSDLVAKVFDRKTEVGKITISIKNTKTWKHEYLEQIERNMEQDSTKVGILVTNKLPKKANPTGELIHNNGVLYCLVHPDHVKSLYVGLRQVVIHMHETKQYITTKEQELMRIGHISKALAQWISGDEFKEIQGILDEIRKDSSETTELHQKIQNQMMRDIKKANDKQSSIQQHVLNQRSLLSRLKNLLSKSGDGEE
mgnify:FL=1|jgi:hypothetical protein